MGYAGACRRDELTQMSIEHIQYKEDTILVTVPKTKTNMPRLFVITEVEWITLIKKYFNLRPKGVATKRFFITYRKGRCTSSPIGINKISQVPKIIASFLKLPNPEQYTGHCLRRSSASHLANHGGDLITIKRHGGWKSSTVAEGYIEASLKKKIEVADMFRTATPQPSTSTFTESASSSNSNFSVQHGLQGHQQTANVGSSANYLQNVFSQSLPGISINAQDTSKVTVNVYNNCTITTTNKD